MKALAITNTTATLITVEGQDIGAGTTFWFYGSKAECRELARTIKSRYGAAVWTCIE